MPKLSERYLGTYEVFFSLEADPKVNTKPSKLLCKRVDITGLPLIVKCFEKKKSTHPTLVIPLERMVGIQKIEPAETKPATPSPTGKTPKTKARAKTKN